MGNRKIWLAALAVFVLSAVVVVAVLGSLRANRYQTTGTLALPGLDEPVTVVRDDKGMATVYAQGMDDLLFAQGFVTAQDRLFQMELSRLFSSGRIGELAGERAEALDTRMRTLGFRRQAERHVELLSPATRRFLQRYLDGVNAYVLTRPGTHHLEFSLAGIEPAPWEIADTLTLAYYMSWMSAANLETEIVAQMLVERVGVERAREIFPLVVNPDDEGPVGSGAGEPGGEEEDGTEDPAGEGEEGPAGGEVDGNQPSGEPHGLFRPVLDLSPLAGPPLALGSNNWVAGPRMSVGGRPILANDTHQDPRLLPGPWYPTGLVTPELRAVGATIPGIPGMVLGRTDRVAFGVTNAYADAQDLYVEVPDPARPGHYLEGEASFPYEIVEETLRFKDDEAPGGFGEKTIQVRLTHRGPVVSDVLPGLDTDAVLSLRWAPFESMGPDIGLDRLLVARSAADVSAALSDLDILMLNFVFADVDGDIGWAVSGRLPIRARGDGTVPAPVVDGSDDWVGWIPFPDNPQVHNPARGWVGTCNHATIPRDYPYYYSSHLAPSWRYRRLSELLDAPGARTAADHWAYQRDQYNAMAAIAAPLMATALEAQDDTAVLGRLLAEWDHEDRPELAAPLVFQAVYRRFAWLVVADELGEDLASVMLADWYFWQERLLASVVEGSSPWFDDVDTAGAVEGRDDLFVRAAREVLDELGPQLGADPTRWRWGQVHRLELVSPIRRDGLGKGLLGGGSHPMGGSGETLYRGIYEYGEPYEVAVSASVRMVADLADDDKVLAVLPGGIAGRVFHPHHTDQVEAFMSGDEVYWWFSDAAIEEHAVTRLELVPDGG